MADSRIVGRWPREDVWIDKREPRKRRSFTPEFMAEVVELCRAGGRSIGHVCRDLDLTDTAVRRWVTQAEQCAAAGLNINHVFVDEQAVDEVHRHGLSVWAWTVDDEVRITELAGFRCGFDHHELARAHAAASGPPAGRPAGIALRFGSNLVEATVAHVLDQ